MPADVTGRKLTIADLRPIERIPAAKPFRIGERPVTAPAKAAQRPPAPQPPAKVAKAATPAPAPVPGPVKAGPPPKPPAKRAPVVLPPPPADWVPPGSPGGIIRDADGFPCGWWFERYSWRFHRSLWRQHGLRLEFGEYGHVRRQCRLDAGGEKLDGDVWRVALRDGRQIIVLLRGRELYVALPDDGWQERAAQIQAAIKRGKQQRRAEVARAR